MFTFLSRFRRQTAVLTALALVASVLVAVPVAAADDPPKADYEATFSACVGGAAGDAGFTDVPSGHENAGDINCIAYYGITQGTSATTYSPFMSVTREHMALFLTRLAGLVDIDMASDPDDAGFTDIGELSAESQTAINQLADLGITQGTSTTTYSPEDSVKRGHMALFIARLMDQMDPMADGETEYGYTPEEVVDVPDGDDADEEPDKTVQSPFTDLQSSTKEAYDAITALWELGVASGISDTSYIPDANITRAAMADFMAGVLDHSNARPAGVTIQAASTSGFGAISTTIAVSYRDDMFAPMVDVSVKVFDSDTVGSFNEDGGCTTASDCAWTDDESLTDVSGNIFQDGIAENGKMNTYYAWMGDADADENDFDVDTSPHATVTLSSTTDAVNLKVTTDINENSTGGNTEDIDGDGSVTLTAQLVDGNDDPVAKSGVEVSLVVVQGGQTLHPAPASIKTNDDGQVTYTTGGPKSTKGDQDRNRTDTVQFRADVNGNGELDDAATDISDPSEQVTATILWTDTDPTLVSATSVIPAAGDLPEESRTAVGTGKGSTDPYAFLSGQDRVTIRATVSFYDQYGNPAGKGQNVEITIGEAPDNSDTRTVSSRGMARWTRTLAGSLGTPVAVSYNIVTINDDGTTADVADAPDVANTSVIAVRHADDDSTRAATEIEAVYDKEDRFLIATAGSIGALYSYDDGDTFINGISGHADVGKRITLDQFEGLIKAGAGDTAGTVEVVFYDDDGVSIFRVTAAGS